MIIYHFRSFRYILCDNLRNVVPSPSDCNAAIIITLYFGSLCCDRNAAAIAILARMIMLLNYASIASEYNAISSDHANLKCHRFVLWTKMSLTLAHHSPTLLSRVSVLTRTLALGGP